MQDMVHTCGNTDLHGFVKNDLTNYHRDLVELAGIPLCRPEAEASFQHQRWAETGFLRRDT
ncbi:hypothetical protein FB106_11468 [Synechococcus sp. Ace-Pa]|nr:hypothetical protein FB106_11468 [Synechococcus sp. Ace-Pa]